MKRYTNEIDDAILYAWNNSLCWGSAPFHTNRKLRNKLYHVIKEELSKERPNAKKIGELVWDFFRSRWTSFLICNSAIPSVGRTFIKGLSPLKTA